MIRALNILARLLLLVAIAALSVAIFYIGKSTPANSKPARQITAAQRARDAELRPCMVYLPAMKNIKKRHWCEIQQERMS